LIGVLKQTTFFDWSRFTAIIPTIGSDEAIQLQFMELKNFDGKLSETVKSPNDCFAPWVIIALSEKLGRSDMDSFN
jgi:hypothetical protein